MNYIKNLVDETIRKEREERISKEKVRMWMIQNRFFNTESFKKIEREEEKKYREQVEKEKAFFKKFCILEITSVSSFSEVSYTRIIDLNKGEIEELKNVFKLNNYSVRFKNLYNEYGEWRENIYTLEYQ
jgi:hypothetical protein